MKKLLTAKDISTMLQISRSKAYSLMNSNSFPSIKIDKCLRVLEEDFFVWLKNYKKSAIIPLLESGKE